MCYHKEEEEEEEELGEISLQIYQTVIIMIIIRRSHCSPF